MKTLTHEPKHQHGLGTRSPFCLFSEGQKEREEKVSAGMQISDRTRPLLSVPNPRARSGNDMKLDEMNDERDQKKKKSGAARRQKDGVHARIKRKLDPSAYVSGKKGADR